MTTRNNLKYLFILFILFASCNSTKEENSANKQIETQIYSTVDYIRQRISSYPFISIELVSIQDSIYFYFNTYVPLRKGTAQFDRKLNFIGYKEFNNSCLLFFDNLNQEYSIYNIVDKRRLNKNEDEIINKVKEWHKNNMGAIIEPIRRVYYLSEKDSLIFVKEIWM